MASSQFALLSVPPPYEAPSTSLETARSTSRHGSPTGTTTPSSPIPTQAAATISGQPIVINGIPHQPPVQEPYPHHDPYVDALKHVDHLQKLCMQGRDSDRSRVLHMGELVTGMVQLLRKARMLDAMDIQEEQEQLKDILMCVL